MSMSIKLICKQICMKNVVIVAAIYTNPELMQLLIKLSKSM